MPIDYSRIPMVTLLGLAACTTPVVMPGAADDHVSLDAGIRGNDARDSRLSGPDASPAVHLVLDASPSDSATAEAALCSVTAVAPQMIYPEMMIVQDISGSMAGDRWAFTKAALIDLADTLDSRVWLGLYVFPQIASSGSSTCQLQSFGPGEYVHVAPALGTATKIRSVIAQVDLRGPTGATPTAEALAVIRDYFINHTRASPGTPKYVVLLTDGSPNCTGGNGSSLNDTVSQAATLAQIQALRADGTVVYVVGYEILSELRAVMNQWASAGGGYTKYINVTNQQALSSALGTIANAIIPCDYQVDAVPKDLSYVRVQLDGGTLKLNDPDGWVMVENRVRLQGAACSVLRNGQPHALKVQVECAPISVL